MKTILLSALFALSYTPVHAIFIDDDLGGPNISQNFITLVQSTSNGRINTNAPTVVFENNITTGNLIVFALSAAEEPMGTPTDSRGNTYIMASSGSCFAGTGTYLWYAKGVIGGSNTITVTGGAATNDVAVYAYEYAGASKTDPLSIAVSNTGNNTTPLTSDFLVRDNNSIIFAIAVDADGSGQTYAAAGSYTKRNEYPNGSQFVGSATEDHGFNSRTIGGKIYNASFTLGTSTTWAILGAVFRP